jgi:hypothetical protein
MIAQSRFLGKGRRLFVFDPQLCVSTLRQSGTRASGIGGRQVGR